MIHVYFLIFLGVAEFVGGQGTVQPFVNRHISLLSTSYPQNPMSCTMSTIILAGLTAWRGGKL